MLATLVLAAHVSRVSLGHTAVYLFFILSGFWICVMWDKRYSIHKYPYAVFIVSRLWRLLPVFILCNAITWTLLLYRHKSIFGTDQQFHLVFSSVFILGYNSLKLKPIVPAWSLDIETQFYLIAPLLVVLMRRRVWVLLLCGAISLLSTFWLRTSTLPPYLFFFALGVASASFVWRPGKGVGVASLFGSGLLFIVVLASHQRGILLSSTHGGIMAAYNEQAQVFFALTLFPFAIYTTSRNGEAFDGVFADLSYIVYMLHWAIIQAMVIPVQGALPKRFMALVSSIVVIGVLSMLIWKYFDHPINELRANWVRKQKRSDGKPRSATSRASICALL
jgi:peptidoglycan/LPS O-acetylase OafA/YrhL